ncbi:MAG: hypothetical protein F6J87_26290 [Spirulina sp. SIO3F2]|nr:hypothetical protein [Spirulina sp. SIO3F2]
MKIYHYGLDGHFVGEGIADPSPLQPEQWLIPARATAQQPPSTKAGERARFVEGEWRIEPLPEPTEPPLEIPVSPSWVGFRRELQLAPEFLAIASATPENGVLSGLLFQHLQSLQADPSYGDDVALVWNAMVQNAPLTDAQILAIAEALERHNIPIALDLATGQIVMP